MKTKVKKLQQAMNDYLLYTDSKNNIVYNNLSLFYDLSFYLEKGLFGYFNSHSNSDYYSKITQVSLFDKIKLIENFYKEVGVDLDLDIILNDGTINFEYYDYCNNTEDSEEEKLLHFAKGNCYYTDYKKVVNICNNGFITDVLVAVHELSHYRDQPFGDRNQVNHLLTEALSCAEELICTDYLAKLGYKEDMELWKNILFNTFFIFANKTRPVYKMFLVHKDLGNISEENYEFYYGNKDEYEKIINFMSQFTYDGDFYIYNNSEYIMGAILGIYMYSQFKKDKSFFKNIIDLHDRINDSSELDCFKIMGLHDLDEEDIEKIIEAVNEIQLDLDKNILKKKK